MYKIYHGFSNGFKQEIFILRHQNQYNLRNWSGFCVLIIRSVDLGSEGVSQLCPKVWKIKSTHKNESDTKDKFKIDAKKRKTESCLCRLQNIYQPFVTCLTVPQVLDGYQIKTADDLHKSLSQISSTFSIRYWNGVNLIRYHCIKL